MSSRLSSLLVQDGLVSAKRVADAFQRQVIYGGTLLGIFIGLVIGISIAFGVVWG